MAADDEKDDLPSPTILIERPEPVAFVTRNKEYLEQNENDSRSFNSDSTSITTVADHDAQDHETPDLERTTTQKLPLVKVPRSERRGLFARFAAISEVTEPTHYTNKTKWTITAVVALAAAAAPVGSAIILPTLSQVEREFKTSSAVTNLSVALYMLSMAIFPLWWSSFSERSGRRSIYIVSFASYTIFGVLSAISPNIAMLVVMRLLNGGSAASVQAVGAGTIADLWEPIERGRAMGMFYLGPLLGPLIGTLYVPFRWLILC